MVRDLICGMEITQRIAKYMTVHQGKSYYFCCAMCLELFENNPKKYLFDKESQN